MTVASSESPDFDQAFDEAIATAAKRIIDAHDHEWSAWEVHAGLRDLMRLRDGDCAYDRPSIGVSYALWHHGSRTQDALQVLRRHVGDGDDALRIVDLGCGTGATASAIALLAAERRRAGRPARPITVEGVDTSPFMVEAAGAIHHELCLTLGVDHANATFSAQTWDAIEPRRGVKTLLVGGYLFDRSDDAHAAELAERVASLGERLEAAGAVLYTTRGKRAIAGLVQTQLVRLGWISAPALERPAGRWRGELLHCARVRRDWYATAGIQLPPASPTWDGTGEPITVALRRPAGHGGVTLLGPSGLSLLRDELQTDAATPDGRLTVIVGAAGSGKSLVLAQRVVHTIEATAHEEPPAMLVTAFNKGVVDLLADWIARLMRGREGFAEVRTLFGEAGKHEIVAKFNGHDVRLTLLNRDRLPFAVFGLPPRARVPRWKDVIADRRARVAGITPAMDRRLTPGFLEEELEQVIYGLGCLTRDAYLKVERTGRGVALDVNARQVVWDILREPEPPESFVERRIDAYRRHRERVEAGQQLMLRTRWTHVFVDECQDFTPTDFQLLARVPPDPSRFVVAGDEAQAIHLGTAYRRPGIRGRQWRRHPLSASYRLPLRICEALRPLADQLEETHAHNRSDEIDVVPLESRKGAVLGPRPIVLAGGASLVRDLRQVLDAYRPMLGARRACVLCAEHDRSTEWALQNAGGPSLAIDVGQMDRVKGLEWPCVVFSDRARLELDDESLTERIFTALTRTTALLLVVLWADGDPRIKACLGRLRRDRLLFWTSDAETAFDRIGGR